MVFIWLAITVGACFGCYRMGHAQGLIEKEDNKQRAEEERLKTNLWS